MNVGTIKFDKLAAGTCVACTAVLGFLTLLASCVSAMGGAVVPGYTLVDAERMAKVDALNEPQLATDAKLMAGKNLPAGTPEYYAGLCMQTYIDARHAEWALDNGSDATQHSNLQGTIAGSYGACAQHCRVGAERQSAYSAMVAKYQPLCAQGAAKEQAAWKLDALDRAVETFRGAKEPLALYFANRDSVELLRAAEREVPDSREVSSYAKVIDQLAKRHRKAISKGQAFFEGKKAQANFEKRATIEAERRDLEVDLELIKNEQDALKKDGSLDAYMRSRKLDDKVRAKARLIAAKDRELARLKRQYTEMAVAAGVARP